MKEVKSFLIVIAVLAISSLSVQGLHEIRATSSAKVATAGDEVVITVYVNDSSNYAVTNAKVNLSMFSGSGTINPRFASTNSIGVAKMVYTVGALPATNVIKIESGSATPVLLSIEGKASPPTEFSVSLDQEKIYPETQCSLIVVVRNIKGKGSSDIPVTIKSSSLVNLEPLNGKTNAEGKFTVSLKSGKTLGTDTIEITAGSLAAQTKEIKIVPYPVTTFTAIAEPYAIYTRSKTTIKIKVADSRSKAVSGAKLAFQITNGNAELEKNEAVTDSNGVCLVKLKSGTNEGTVTVSVKLADKERESDIAPVLVNISVTKLILPPAKLEFSSDYPFAMSGNDVTFTALVLDKEGNPVVGAAVAFEVTEGGGKLQQVLLSTGQEGKTKVTLTTGKKAGVNTVKAKCEQLPPAEASIKTEGKVVYTRKPAGKPAKLFAFIEKKGERLSVDAVITDENFVPVNDVQVYFKIIKGEGSLSSELSNTDIGGTASAAFIPEGYGVINIQVSAPAIFQTKGLIYKKNIPVFQLLISVASLFLLLLFIYFPLRGKRLKLQYLDQFTGLNNELFAKYRLKKAIRNKSKFTALFLNFNHFKSFNSINGYEKGNELIKAVADILKINIGQSGVVCHLGGDDFVVIMKPEKVEDLPERLLAEISEMIKSFYPVNVRKKESIILKDKTGKEYSCPLASVAMAVLESDRFLAVNFNDFLDGAGKVMKSAKSKNGNAIAYDVDKNPDAGKQYKIGWFTIIGFLMILFFSIEAFSAESTMILSAWSSGSGKTVKISAHVTDLKERPVSNAFILFSVEKGDGMLENGYAATDDGGNCAVNYTVGQFKGYDIIKVCGEELTPVDVEIKKSTSGLEVLMYFSLIMFTAFIVILLVKIFNLRLLIKGIDKDSGVRTRFFAGKYIGELILGDTGFVTTFIQFRDFQEYCKVYGYEKGDKTIKFLSGYIKEAVIANGGKQDDIFYYWQDHFVIVSPLMRSEGFAKKIIEQLDTSVSLLCEDHGQNFYTLQLLMAQVESDKLKHKGLEEIMEVGEILINKAKTKTGSTCLSYSEYLLGEKEKHEPVPDLNSQVKKELQ